MTFEPEPKMRIDLDGEFIEFAPLESSGPAAVFVYAEAGKEGTVYKVLKGKEYYALKVFYPEYQDKRLLKNTEQLSQFKHLEGFRVAERTVINHKYFSKVVDQFPELNYSVLMPWIQGTVWGNLMTDDPPLQREEYLQIAQLLMRVVYGLESRGLAHCDLSANNFIINTTLSSIELVDIEDMYAPDMPRPIPNISFGTVGYRTKWIAENGLWGPESDRFASAVLCSEIITWYNNEIRENKAGNASFFDEAEIGEDSERFKIMKDCLGRLSDDFPILFEKAWFSKAFDQCPPVADWLNAVEKIGTSMQGVKEETDLSHPENLSKRSTRAGRKNDNIVISSGQPRMEISHSILDFGVLQPNIDLQLSITNPGGSILNGNINSVFWLETSPSRISIQPGETQIIKVSLKDTFPRPKSGFEYRTPNALIIESNTGVEVIGARYIFSSPSLYNPWSVSLILGLVIIALYAVPFVKSDLIHVRLAAYFGITGLIVGLTTNKIKSFRDHWNIVKAVGINALILLLIRAIFDAHYDSYNPNMVTEIISNSIFLVILMVIFAKVVGREKSGLVRKVVEREESKVAERKIARSTPKQETAGKPVYEGEHATRQSSLAIVYVFADDGTPLYRSLPASNNWIVWLEKGSELSTVQPVEEVTSSLRKFGYYIEVVDKNGNKGFVTATAVKIKRSKK